MGAALPFSHEKEPEKCLPSDQFHPVVNTFKYNTFFKKNVHFNILFCEIRQYLTKLAL